VWLLCKKTNDGDELMLCLYMETICLSIVLYYLSIVQPTALISALYKISKPVWISESVNIPDIYQALSILYFINWWDVIDNVEEDKIMSLWGWGEEFKVFKMRGISASN